MRCHDRCTVFIRLKRTKGHKKFSSNNMSARIATGAYSAAAMLNLYRSIIRLHRKKLPPALRTMGNTYVRHEFDLHKKANLTQVDKCPLQP